jgi:hypothetical protein
MRKSLAVLSATAIAGAVIYGESSTPAFATVAPKSVGTPTMVADWAMNDGSDGVMTDASSFNNDGDLTNVATGTGWYHFPLKSGKTSRVVVPNDPSLNPDDQTFAVSMHLSYSTLPSVAVGDYDLIRKGQASDGHDWKIEIMEDGRVRCLAHGTKGSKALLSSKPLTRNSWHTIVCTFAPSAVSLTVDSTTKEQSANVGTVANSAVLSIAAKAGGGDDGGDQYTGSMNDVVITKG